MAYVKRNTLTYDEVFALIDYNPLEGTFTWKISPAKNTKAGAPAGGFKGVRTSRKTGLSSRYMYIRINHREAPAARVAWLLTHGAWPDGSIMFKDGDPSNLKIDNLREAQFTRIHSDPETKVRHHKPTFEAQRNYTLRRYYGMTLEKFNEKLEAQNHTCAICHGPEVAIIHGKLKPLSVDHCHITGKVRDLLCSHCNHMIGHANERIEVLQSAIKYLEKHSDCANDRQNEGTS